ncbi:hypothetical protein NRS6131_01190 [Bacillus subtilis]|uniref:hypothetical protein n=1 Tax=Bacillus subtilis TaxID=1423 RepID=UPI001B932F2A|nr:hypothetical protein [Bacillus subtilis]MED4559622.1 hypothetical protein [Bacillus subtilis]CAF1851541.1 hypothetical protein NRS6131_04314 [Bacillus subtilis]CAI6231326.1 hypothetical protein NRS6131_01190 [Bacillus subtilis]
MEWSKVFDLIKTILTSWPLAAVVIVFAIRKSLKTVIENRLFSFKIGNVEIIFDRLLEKVDQNLEEASQLSEEEKVDPESVKGSENTQTEKPQQKPQYKPDLSLRKPRILVRNSWREIDDHIRNLVESEIKMRRVWSTRKCINYLAENVIPGTLADALFNLLELRNLLLNENYQLTRDDAVLFRSRCLSAINELSKYTKKSTGDN